MRGDYLLSLADGKTIYLRFCTWSLQRFCEKKNVSFVRFNETILTDLNYGSLVHLILAAAEYDYYKQHKPFPYTDLDVSDWLDELGGVGAECIKEIIPLIHASVTAKKNDLPTQTKEGEPVEITGEDLLNKWKEESMRKTG